MLGIEEAQRLNITNRKHLNWFLGTFTNDRFPFGLHFSMFTNVLQTMTTEEQKRKFLPLAQSLRMIGTYAQTELGHGTNIRQLETEAVFDPKTDSFVLNTPTLTSTKFWPGALGSTANHVILMAQLYTPNRAHP